MTAVVDIYNLALSACGTKARVAAVNEVSREAETCTLWYPHVRRLLLAAANWPSTLSVARLAMTVERDVDEDWVATDPTPGWRFAYSAPNDMLRPRHLSDFSRFIMTTNSLNANVISAQMEDAVLAYTKDQPNPDRWDPELQMAIVYALAAYICLPLHGKNDRARLVKEEANLLIMNARVTAANSGENSYESIPDWIAARGSAFSSPTTRYHYPFGQMLTVTEGVAVT